MKLGFLSIIIFLITTIPIKVQASTYGESYTLQIPERISINENHSFKIKIISNNLGDNETVKIKFDKDFTLHDQYGKEDVNGHIENDEIEITSNDCQDQEIFYQIENISAGKWRGNINASVKLNKSYISGMLLDGNSLNAILQEYMPKQITFSHETYTSNYADISGKPYIDVSLGQDESALLYKSSSTGYTITSNGNENLYANYDCENMFSLLSALTKINNLNLLDTSYTTNMKSMFSSCAALTTLDVSNFITNSVTNMANMFSSCGKLKSITGLNNFVTNNVTDMSSMFSSCYKLATGIEDTSSFNTSNVTNTSHMFESVNFDNKTTKATLDLDLSNWDLSNNNDMSYMFKDVYMLKSVNFSDNVSTSSLENMSYMLSGCLYIDNVNLSKFDTSNVKDMSYLFNDCRLLIHTGNLNNWNVSNVTNIDNMFYSTWNIDISETGNLNSWNVKNNISKNNTFGGESTYENNKPRWY